MLRGYTAALLVATALTAGPALAQTTTGGNETKPSAAGAPAPAPMTPAPSTAATTGSTSATQTASKDAGDHSYIIEEAADSWRASKVIGLSVYNEQDEKVGSINELLFNKDGKVEGVVIGVGGFLGIGESNVGVNYSELKWSMTAPKSNSTVASSTAPAGSTANPTGTGTLATPGLGNPGTTPAAPGAATRPAPSSAGTAGTPTLASASNTDRPPAYPDHAILPNASKDQLKKAPQFKYGGAPR